MGLIARTIEAAGIPTLSMTSALSITRSVNPPRAAFLDFPLGHTTGKAHDRALQRSILKDALAAFHAIDTPGDIVHLDYAWSTDDAWKDAVMRPRAGSGAGAGRASEASTASAEDDRAPRHDTPQYQSDEDRRLAEQALARDGCPSCVFLD